MTSEYLLIGIFSLWFILTILHQLDFTFAKKISENDWFKILPRWTFFAPNPGTNDFHLVFRYKDKSGMVGKFSEIPLHDRRTMYYVWNPEKRRKKALFDLVQELRRTIPQLNELEDIKFSFGYIAVLNYLSSFAVADDFVEVQFAILQTEGYNELCQPELVFTSSFHKLR